MALQDGKNVQIKVGDGASPEVFNALGCQLDGTMSYNPNLTRVLCKSGSHVATGPKEYEVSFSCNRELPASAALQDLIDAAEAQTSVNMQFLSSDTGGPTYSGAFFISYDENAPVSGPSVVSFRAMNEGTVTVSVV